MLKGYVPEPQPAKTDYMIGAHYFPGWKEGEHWGWELIEPYRGRRPLLGFYDEGDPEVADWEIKWALEHGIGYFVYCWYRKRENMGKPVTDESLNLAHALHDGLFHAKFAGRFRFAIMWENENAGGAESEEDLLEHLFPYWLERYFKHPSYLTIGDKPVLYVYHVNNLVERLGGTGNVAAALEKLRGRCREAGFGGLIIQCEYRGTDPDMLTRIRECGFDHSFAYCWHTPQKRPTPEEAVACQMEAMKRRFASDPDGFVPTASVGWDPLPWRIGRGAVNTADVTRWTLEPDRFEQVLRETKRLMELAPTGSLGSRMLLLDNWNEWGEGHYIAPHAEGGFRYLEAVRRVFASGGGEPDRRTPQQLGLGPYDALYRQAQASGKAARVRLFHAADYGAQPDGVSDAGPGIRAAIEAAGREAAATGVPAVVVLERGRYSVGGAEGDRAAVVMAGIRDVTLRGEGSDTVLVVRNPRIGGIEVADSEHVRIEHLAVDYDPLPFTQGIITLVDMAAGAFEVELDAGYSSLDEPHYAQAEARWGLLVDRRDPAQARYGPHPLFAESWEPVGGRVWRIRQSDPGMMREAGIKAGDRYVHMARRYSESAINFWRTRKSGIRDITVYAAPALASIWGLNEETDICSLTVEVLPGSDRLLSANGDGIHNLGTRGGLRIEGCSFEGMADDAINIHARSGFVAEALDSTRLVVQGGLFRAAPGDRLQIYDPQAGFIRAEALVEAAEPAGPGRYSVTLREGVGGIVAGGGFHDADHVYNASACGQNAVIRGNRFGRHRGRGVLLKTVDAIVENNTFDNVEGWGVAIQHEPDWEEGPVSRDIVIRGNTFRGTGFGWQPAIYVVPMLLGGALAEQGVRPVRNITVENNVFDQPLNTIVHVQSAQCVRIRGNRVATAEESVAGDNKRLSPILTGRPLIVLDNASGVEVDDLLADVPGNGPITAVHILKSVDAGDTGIRISGLRRTSEVGTLVVVDERDNQEAPTR